MNKFINTRMMTPLPFLLMLLLLCLAAAPAAAQDGRQPTPGEAEQNAANQGGDLIGILGLTPDQLAKIRALREQHKDERQMINERLRRAQRALDEAIYSDDASEAVIEERARELAAAQAASARLRALTELGIRRVLTPEQLGKLRELRQRQAERRRLEREMNLSRRRPNRQPGINDGGPPLLPRERLRQRQNITPQQNDNNRPATAPREKRVAPLRRVRP